MPGLTETGTLSYNGYTFSGASSCQVSITPTYDESKRTIVSQTHKLSVTAIVIDNSGSATQGSTDKHMENLRKRLMRPGRALKFVNRGFGDDISIPGLTEIANGPNPKSFKWTPVGDDKAAQIEWEIEFTIAVCSDNTPRKSGVMALNWGAQYIIDVHGDTTRILSGYIQIVQKSSKRSSDTADQYRRQFAPSGLAGFHRTQDWLLSKDRSRVDFTITDVQIPSEAPYPPGVVDVTGRYRYSMQVDNEKGIQQLNSISMQITLAAGLSGDHAWLAFFSIFNPRVETAIRKEKHPFFISLDVDEDLFGRTHGISVGYTFTSPLKDIIGETGLWQPMPPQNNWSRWLVSMGGTMLQQRGHTGMGDIAANDAIIDLCTADETIRPNNATFKLRQRKPKSGSLINKMPSAEKSWLKYRSVIMPSAEMATSRQSVLQDPDDDNSYEVIPEEPPDQPTAGSLPQFGTGDFSTETPSAGRIADVIQQTGARKYSVRYAGVAERVGYPIPRPKVLKVGREDAFEVSGRFFQEVKSRAFGVNIYRAGWSIDYMLGNSPGRVGIPAQLG